MRGINHIITGVATAVVITDSYFLMKSAPSYEVTHLVADDIAQLFTNSALSIWVAIPVSIFLYLIGVLLPDIDYPYSTLGKKIYIPIGHRTWLHSIWFVLIFIIAGIWFRVLWFLAFGIFVHLLFDSVSRSGIQWFYPWENRYHKLKLYHTSGVSEYVCVGVVIILTVLYSLFTVQKLYHIFPI